MTLPSDAPLPSTWGIRNSSGSASVMFLGWRLCAIIIKELWPASWAGRLVRTSATDAGHLGARCCQVAVRLLSNSRPPAGGAQI